MSNWKKIPLGKILTESRVISENPDADRRITVLLYARGVEKRPMAIDKEGATKYYKRSAGQFIYGKQNLHKGAFGIVPDELNGFESSLDIPAFDVGESCLPEWILYFFKQDKLYEQLSRIARGMGSKRIHPDDLFLEEIPLPSIAEQKETLKKIKDKERKQQLLIAEIFYQQSILKRIRKAILEDAIKGKLVQQNPKDEHANELLKRIKTEKDKLIKQRKIKKEKSLLPIADVEILFQLPNGWAWCRFIEIATLITDGKHGDCVNELNSGYFFLSAKDIQNGKLLYDNARQIVFTDFAEVHRRTNLESGDLCMVNTGATIGKIAIAPDDANTPKTTFQKSVAVIKLVKKLTNNRFIEILLTHFTPHLLKTSGGSAINNLLLGDLRNVIIPFPPLTEQERIVEKVNDLMRLCEELEKATAYNRQEADYLLNSILREIFATSEEAKIISLPALQPMEEKHFLKRKVLATYIINQSLADNHFGDVKFEKILHLSDYFAIKRNLGQKYFQKAAGPYDNAFTHAYFEQIEKGKWFNRKRIGNQFVFSAGQNHDKSTNTYNFFSTDELQRVNEIISYFKKYDYEQPEIVSTLYAVWNNRIIRQEQITNELLIQDFLNWDAQKIKYKDRLEPALKWMRDKNFVPDGWGNVIELSKTAKSKTKSKKK